MSSAADPQPVPRVASFKTVAAFKRHLATLPIALECDDGLLPAAENPLARPIEVYGRRLGNRFAVHPMEGWDGTPDGRPTDHTRRRWRNFGLAGAKLIWGGEAVAVRHEGRANPNQLLYTEANRGELAELPAILREAHHGRFGTTDDLMAGLQLTHSGRFCRPDGGEGLKPRVAYRHPLLDARFGIADDGPLMSDGELDDLVADFVAAARFAAEAGFDFVDIKHCHGYLFHELLSAHTRPGPYGGSLHNRTRMLRQVSQAIRAEVPGLHLAVRLSAFDLVAFAAGAGPDDRRGRPVDFGELLPYRYGFGVHADNPAEIDLTEPIEFLRICRELGILLVNITAGSPYYTPHIQRPALFPPSDGYLPPEDPLTGCARLLQAAADCKAAVPELTYVGTGYSYLQEYIGPVAQAQVRLGQVDFVGLGRSTLSYPGLPADLLAGQPLSKKLICRTFSDCTTAPRHNLISGCFPLDPVYKALPEANELKRIKKKLAR
ncbi:MAG: NADH:flavin oxidoreductase [bacterium]